MSGDDNNGGTKEKIHSGHFMISNLEAEDKKDEEDDQIPMPDPDELDEDEEQIETHVLVHGTLPLNNYLHLQSSDNGYIEKYVPIENPNNEVFIETTLSKLFNCMQLTFQ